MKTVIAKKRIFVNGINMFYTVQGEGQPLIMIHGNGEDHHIFDQAAIILMEKYQVYLFDSRNHGESTKGDLHYDLMADDYQQAIKTLNICNPIVYGFSDGGIIGLLLAIRKVPMQQLIVSGVNICPKGLKTRFLVMTFLKNLFHSTPEKRLMLREPQIRIFELKGISVPVTLLVGEKDVVKYRHTKMIHQAISNSQMLVVLGANHYNYVMDNDSLLMILGDILTNN